MEGPCGDGIPVARPKNRGGDTTYKETAPVLMTAAQEVTLHRNGREQVAERRQMDRRIRYIFLQHGVAPDEREEVTRHCGHCTARLYLKGRAGPNNPPALAAPAADVAPMSSPWRRLRPASLSAPSAPPLQDAASSSSARPAALAEPGAAASSEQPAKRRRSASEVVHELTQLKALLDAGAVTLEEFTTLKEELLSGN